MECKADVAVAKTSHILPVFWDLATITAGTSKHR